MQIRYKIQFCSSSSPMFPVTNLTIKNENWQSQRFCDYPQILTVSFYQPARIHTIKIGSHPLKTPSRINILYHLPQHQDKGFEKYGFVTFTEPQETKPVSELKVIEGVGFKANEVRLVLQRNHANKGNFFNQVGLSLLEFTGEPIEHLMPVLNRTAISKGFEAQSTLLLQLKQNFIRREQYDEAQQVRDMQLVLQNASQQLQELQQKKQRCVKEQNYMQALKVKEQIMNLRSRVVDLASKFYNPDSRSKMAKSDLTLRNKIQSMNITPNASLRVSAVKLGEDEEDGVLNDVGEVTSQDDQQLQEKHNESMISHQDRILPAVMNKMRGITEPQSIPQASEVGDNEFFQAGDKSTVPAQPEHLSPADEANSSLLLEFYQQMFIRKLHSKHWQYRLESINQAVDELKSNQDPNFLTKLRLRSFLFIYSTVLKNHSFKTTSAALQLMDLLAPMKAQSDNHKELHNQLEQAVKKTLKVAADNNQKLRSRAEKTVLRMIQSSVIGVLPCYSGIVRTYPQKGASKLKKVRLQNLIHLVQKYGVGEGAVPLSVADFSLKAGADPEAQVRKIAIQLIKTVKNRGGKQKLNNLTVDSRVKATKFSEG